MNNRVALGGIIIFGAVAYVFWERAKGLENRLENLEQLFLTRFADETIAACNKAAEEDEKDGRFDRQSVRSLRFLRVPGASDNKAIADVELRSGDWVCDYCLIGRASVGENIEPPPEIEER